MTLEQAIEKARVRSMDGHSRFVCELDDELGQYEVVGERLYYSDKDYGNFLLEAVAVFFGGEQVE